MKKKQFLTSILLFSAIFAGCAVNPISGEKQLMLVSEQQDIAIGSRYAPEAEKQMGGAIASQQLQNYINSVGRKLAGLSQRPDWDYHFVALNDESINAFALPGGYVFLTKGMLRQLTSGAQLAAILAHEIAHIVARHASVVMSREIGIDVLLSLVTSEKTPSGVLTAAGLTRQILGLSYSRADERQADLAGLDYMVKAGFDPYGMVRTMQMLQEQNARRPIDFLSSHPSPENRIAYLHEKIQANYYNVTDLKTGKEDYHSYVLRNLDAR